MRIDVDQTFLRIEPRVVFRRDAVETRTGRDHEIAARKCLTLEGRTIDLEMPGIGRMHIGEHVQLTIRAHDWHTARLGESDKGGVCVFE